MEINTIYRAKFILLCSVLCSVVTFSGCSSMKLGNEDKDMNVGELTMTELEAPVEHRLAPEDQIKVSVWGVPEFSVSGTSVAQSASGDFIAKSGIEGRDSGSTYVIHADGTIDLPLLGNIAIGGLGINDARRLVEKELRRYVKEPKVGLTVSSYNSRKILVLGEVTRPGVVMNPGPKLSLAEALAQVGGSIPLSADTSNVYIIRGVLDEPKVAHVPLDSAVAMFQAQHIWLQSRDVVFVNSLKITDWNRFMSQLLPTIMDAYMLKNLGVVK
jgi:polysaccharide export outer membrane protein